MLLRELTHQPLDEKQAWARSGNKVVRKYRCSGGKRHGRIVSKMSQCYAPINLKARITLKKTKARLGQKIARKTKMTKRRNPASRRVQAMNRAAKGGSRRR
jgi:hypothetical protein